MKTLAAKNLNNSELRGNHSPRKTYIIPTHDEKLTTKNYTIRNCDEKPCRETPGRSRSASKRITTKNLNESALRSRDSPRERFRPARNIIDAQQITPIRSAKKRLAARNLNGSNLRELDSPRKSKKLKRFLPARTTLAAKKLNDSDLWGNARREKPERFRPAKK